MRLFRSRLARGVFALAVVVAVGITGYMVVEGWSLLDSAYMTIITLTTVGYEEVHPLSSTGRIFTIFLMVAGVGVMLYVLTSVVNLAVAHEVGSLFRRRKLKTRIAKLKGHFIVCGFGRVGRVVASTLQSESVPVIVVDNEAEALAEAEDLGLLSLQGDATRDADLISAQIDKAVGLIAATGDDGENVYITLTARGLNPGLHVVARASRPEAGEKLRQGRSEQCGFAILDRWEGDGPHCDGDGQVNVCYRQFKGERRHEVCCSIRITGCSELSQLFEETFFDRLGV